jgi:colanic acid biosynthesis glycosyl transferase WcaI
MPSKLTGMFASGRPVVATADAGTQLAATVRNCGVVVPPGDTARFTEAIVQLAADASLRKRLGQNARRYAELTLDKEAVLTSICQEFCNLAGIFSPAIPRSAETQPLRDAG